ncbi:RCC1 and BTB domain-containing protein 2 [Phytophthora citrophthora]|uniref:RCC1 and BTB domain-containing protein 2 n=1 Tax=Phytophthora citrophthora TaxID=4793 RepID=A0AAD9LGG7_9STRA|nr:RCC1 and BTB domain-containing protein 2 [Phytophthora citrophthora]
MATAGCCFLDLLALCGLSLAHWWWTEPCRTDIQTPSQSWRYLPFWHDLRATLLSLTSILQPLAIMSGATAFESSDALVVSATFLRAAFGGASAVYSLWLAQPCTSVVVVHLLLPSDAAVRLSSDRLCFRPDNCSQPQLVRVEALENRTQWSVVTHRIYSLDRNYDRAVTPDVVVQTEATPLECPLLTFGGHMTKRKAAAMGSTHSTELDILAALPEDTSTDTAEGGAASWCVSHLASGYHFSVAAVVQPKGTTLLSWGLNTNGELGNGTMTSSPTPQQVITLPLQLPREPLAVVHVSCGKHHVGVITGQARLFTWGSNKHGQLGLGDFQSRTQPEEVPALATLSSHRRALRVMHTVQRGGNNVTHVVWSCAAHAHGFRHALFVTQQILGMGYNQAGQLGLGHCLQQRKGWRSCTPIAVESLRDQSILDLAAGQNHSACALSNGDVYTWGCGDDGRLGDGKLGESVAKPTLVALLREASIHARAVRCGARHMAVISDSDLLYLWGANDFGQLGCKDKKPRSRPFLLTTPALITEGVEDVALGEFHTTCVTSAGKAYTWGQQCSCWISRLTTEIELPGKERVENIVRVDAYGHCGAYYCRRGQAPTSAGIERERMNQRKAEVVRWRAFIAATVPLTHRESKRRSSRVDQRLLNEKAVARTTACKKQVENQSKKASVLALEKLVTSYANEGLKEARKNVTRVLSCARRDANRNEEALDQRLHEKAVARTTACLYTRSSKQSKLNSTSESQHLKGIFYHNQLRQPELPAATSFSPTSTSSGRKLWSTAPDWHPVTLYPTPPPRYIPTTIVSNQMLPVQQGERRRSASGDGSFKRSARIPTSVKRPTTPSPRSRVMVVEALLHQPSYSITQGVLLSARSAQALADAYRTQGATSSSMRAAYGGKAKASRLAASKNQQPPGSMPASVLPRIDRLPQKPQAPSLISSPASVKNGGLSILLPRRPSSKDKVPAEETSPTFHGDETDGRSAKAAWCTPRNPVSQLPTGSRVASFFAEAEGSGEFDNSSIPIATPLRLQSVEDNINTNALALVASNDKFFEMTISANQHLDQIHSQLPCISDVFDQTACTLQGLSTDIATLHEQHKSALNDMANQFEAAMNNNTEEMVTLSEAHANEKAEILQAHERELQETDEAFRIKVIELNDKYNEMEKSLYQRTWDLRQTTETQVQALQESNRVEREERERSANAVLEALQLKTQTELDAVRSIAEAAYTDLQQRSQLEFTELQRTSTDELTTVKQALTAEISSLKQKATASLAALAERSELELQSHREQSNEALQRLRYFYTKEREYLMEKNAEEVARLRMFEIEQSSRMEATVDANRLRMFEIEQSSRMEERRCREAKSLQDELGATKTKFSRQIEDLHRRYTSEVEILKATSEAEKNLMLQTHASKTESIRSIAAQELATTIVSYETRLQQMSEAHAIEMTRNKEEAGRAREALISKYETSMASLQNERSREKYALILRYETELESVKQANKEQHDKTVQLQEAQVIQLREAHASRVLALEMAVREQSKQTEDMIREKDAELDCRQERIGVLENIEMALNERHDQFVEQSRELVEQKCMALSELENEIWRLDQLNIEKDLTLDSTNRSLKAAEEELQIKANTILELTFVIKSRDDEIEKLRNALLDTVQTVNTKTEILELTTETLSSKAKELEATKNALRLESGKLSMVEESMNQKVGMLENSELKMESMRLNLENMRLEMKRMQMDMKLQLEHTEGEIELKNGEIRRLHGAQNELKQKNDFSQQTIERLEQALVTAQRQGEEAQRRIELLRLETAQAAEDVKKVCDELLDKEQELVLVTREKQTVTTEKQRLQIQFNNLTHEAAPET